MSKQPRIVAELGRPETPAETAARKAEQSRLYRSRKTINNLVFSLLVTLCAVALIVVAVPRGTITIDRTADYVAIAATAQQGVQTPLLVPQLPQGWESNEAALRYSSGQDVRSWFIGFITPEQEYAALSQGIASNPSWVAGELSNSLAQQTVQIGGYTWTFYDNSERGKDAGNIRAAYTTTVSTGDVIVYGTARTEELETLVNAVADQLAATQQRPVSEGTQ